MYALSLELFGAVLPVDDFPRLPGIRGLGISDSADYAEILSRKFEYANTWYHREPRFDVTGATENGRGGYDFILCSEVLEHVTPPVEAAFRNLFCLLKPTGVLIVTVPYTLGVVTAEHFPELHDWGLAQLKNSLVLVNRTPGGKLEMHENLVFHGGSGSTLELRVFCERDLRRDMRSAGFREVRFYSSDAPEWGIAHTGWSLPFSARKEPFALPLSSAADWAEQWESALEEIRSQRESIAALQASVAHLSQRETELGTELTARTEWAKRLDAELESAGARIAALEADLEARTQWALRTEKDLQERSEWALHLQRDVNHHVEVAETLHRELAEATEQLNRASAELDNLRHSRVVRMGKKLGLR
jgi:hypothetical protein